MPVGGLLPDASQQLGEARLAVRARRFHRQDAGQRPRAVELVLKTRHERPGADLAVALPIEADEDVALSQYGRGDATVSIRTVGAARAVGRVERLGVPPAELAIMLHRGLLADADLTYGELGAHVMRHEISVEGPLREHYLTCFLDTYDPGQ